MREKFRVVFAFTLIAIGIAGLYQCEYVYGMWSRSESGWSNINYGRFDFMFFLLEGGSLFLVIAGLASFKRWKWYSREAFAAIALSVVLTVTLIYLTFIFFIKLDELFLLNNRWRLWLWLYEGPLAYAPFAILLGLIIAGFLAKKGKLSILGSITLYLPTFGHLLYDMWVLYGVNNLAFLWLPLYDFCPQVFSLGHIVLLPNLLANFWIDHLGMEYNLASRTYCSLLVAIMMLGVAIFLLGTTTWLHGKFKKFKIIDFGIYRYSRHPQYLGLLLWSYALLLLATATYSTIYTISPRSSLPWLILALTTIGIALHEENAMAKKYGEKYLEYRSNTPFLFPLPKQFSKLIRAPVKVIFKKDWPENRKEVACVIMIYGLVLVLLSFLISTQQII